MSLVKELVRAGLWEKAKAGFRIHDWADYNPTAQEAADYQERMREVRSLGGKARAAGASRAAGRFAPAGTSRTAVQQRQQATSPVPVPVPVPVPTQKIKEREETPSLSANGENHDPELTEEQRAANIQRFKEMSSSLAASKAMPRV
jgi:hypothetical protein